MVSENGKYLSGSNLERVLRAGHSALPTPYSVPATGHYPQPQEPLATPVTLSPHHPLKLPIHPPERPPSRGSQGDCPAA